MLFNFIINLLLFYLSNIYSSTLNRQNSYFYFSNLFHDILEWWIVWAVARIGRCSDLSFFDIHTHTLPILCRYFFSSGKCSFHILIVIFMHAFATAWIISCNSILFLPFKAVYLKFSPLQQLKFATDRQTKTFPLLCRFAAWTQQKMCHAAQKPFHYYVDSHIWYDAYFSCI